MANYFLDNEDIRFLFDHYDLGELARLQETDAENGDADYVPVDDADAVDNYRRVLEIVGQVAAETIAPNAEEVDRDGNTLNDNGTVTLHPKVQENIWRMRQADLMGFTLPRRYGGLNCPTLIYAMANEMVSRGDASFMNIFGLQAIGETVNAFASQEIKNEYLPRFASGEATGRHGVDGAGCGKRSSGGPPAGASGRPGQLVSSTASSVSSPTAAATSC